MGKPPELTRPPCPLAHLAAHAFKSMARYLARFDAGRIHDANLVKHFAGLGINFSALESVAKDDKIPPFTASVFNAGQ
jgi:hypothetical protein